MPGGRRNRSRINTVHHKNSNYNENNGAGQIPHSQTNSSETNATTNVLTLPFCHPVLPDLGTMGPITFEIIFFVYLNTALFCQHIYLFKTVWWYPVTLPPSTTSLNFHLIDKNLALFIGLLLLRRIIWSTLWNLLRPRSDNSAGLLLWLVLCIIISSTWMLCLLLSLFYLYSTSSMFHVMVLFYPIIFWLPFTILSSDSSLHLILSWLSLADWDHQTQRKFENNGNSNANGIHMPLTRLLDQPETIGDLNTSYANLGKALDANQVRYEVKLLCRDFNSRVSEIVFCSVLSAYYVGFVPMFFMKPQQYYDVPWCLQHTILILLNSFIFMTSHLLHPRYLHVMHKCASLLGGYKKVDKIDIKNEWPENDSITEVSKENPVQIYRWTKLTVFSEGKYVSHKDKLYKSLWHHNTAEPDDSTHARFFFMFSDPLKILNWLLGCHFIIVLYQIQLLIVSSKWDHLISLALMQFYSLFRNLHDRIVLGKAYSLHKQLYSDTLQTGQNY